MVCICSWQRVPRRLISLFKEECIVRLSWNAWENEMEHSCSRYFSSLHEVRGVLPHHSPFLQIFLHLHLNCFLTIELSFYITKVLVDSTLFCISKASLDLVRRFKRRTFYIGSLGAKLILCKMTNP